MAIVLAALLAVACGGDADTPTPLPTATATTAPPVPSPSPSPTAIPTPTPLRTLPSPNPSPTPKPSPAAVVLATPTSAPPSPSPTSAPAPTQAASGRLATLEIRATDDPLSQEVSKILVTVNNIEVNIAKGDVDGGWTTVVDEPTTFDLMQIIGVEEILGSAELTPGQYNQIRLTVEDVVVTVQGADLRGKVPSGRLKIAGQFTAVAGETTILTLDFDAAKSVVVTGAGKIIIKPVIKLLARKGGEPLSAAKVKGATQPEAAVEPTATPSVEPTTPATIEPTVPPTPEPTLPPTPTPSPTPVPTPEPTATPIPPTPTPTPEPPIVSSDIKDFTLEDLTIQVGTEVKWTHKGAIVHTTTSGVPGAVDVGELWDSGSPFLVNGETFSHTFTKAGIFPYFCTVHGSTMTATITVVESLDGQESTSSSSDSGGSDYYE